MLVFLLSLVSLRAACAYLTVVSHMVATVLATGTPITWWCHPFGLGEVAHLFDDPCPGPLSCSGVSLGLVLVVLPAVWSLACLLGPWGPWGPNTLFLLPVTLISGSLYVQVYCFC